MGYGAARNLQPLATSYPAESPVAFGEVLTGCNPGKHGIFDFLHRDRATYLPSVSLYRQSDEGYQNGLASPTLSGALRREGVRHALVRIPCTFPTPDSAELAISGLGVPDALGGWGRAQAFVGAGPKAPDMFGVTESVYEAKSAGTFVLSIAGPGGARADMTVKREGSGFRTGDVVWPAGRFSPWTEVAFPDGRRVVCSIHATGGAREPVFTVTPLWTHPSDLRVPAVRPTNFASRLEAAHGLFPVSGWPEPNHLYAEGRVDFPAFLEMCDRSARDLELHAFDVFSDPAFDFTLVNYELFDRLAHAGIGHTASPECAAALLGAVIRFDAFIGKVRASFPDATVWVASDHGFAPWSRRVNLNRWLAENGYLAADLRAPDPTLTNLADGSLLWSGVDWSRTKAYALGLSKIYLNLEGREAHGIVPPGRPARALVAELRERLENLKDPETRKPVFRRVLESSRLYWGTAIDRAGDLVLCYNEGYRTDWISSLGGVGTPVVSPNRSNWKADHCGVDPELIPGIFLSDDAPDGDDPTLRTSRRRSCVFSDSRTRRAWTAGRSCVEGRVKLDFAKVDCRHFLGEKPCAKKRDGCADCPHYDPMGVRVLVVKLAAMGDVVRTTPILVPIRARHERVHVTWVVDAATAPLLRGAPGIDLVTCYDASTPSVLAAQKFDELYCLDKEPRAIALSALIDAPHKKGFTMTPFGTLGIHDDDAAYAYRLGVDDPFKFLENQKSYQQIVFEAAGFSFNNEPVQLAVNHEDRADGRAVLAKLGVGPYLGLNTSAGDVFATKRLPEETTAEIAPRAAALGLRPVLLGGPTERERNARILALSKGAAYDAGCDHPVRRFAGIVSNLAALVCADTLAMHLAVSENVPVVAVFGPTCHQEVHLYGRGEKVIQTPWCAPCYKSSCGHHTCMNDVRAEDVIAALTRLGVGARV
ncbi:MAG: alkaline phosphatase family protein [Deltaproteobacteria bacterium]|nr:alkaline phosphatase family protein [Deltaproteobacteria bacterium]